MKKEMDRFDLLFSTLIMAAAMIMMIGAVGYSAKMFTLDFLALPTVYQSLEERGLMFDGSLPAGAPAVINEELQQENAAAGVNGSPESINAAPQQEMAPAAAGEKPLRMNETLPEQLAPDQN